MYKLTKKELNDFEKFNKRLGISLDEYTKYIENLRKVNAKTARMRRKGNAFYTPKFSKSVSAIQNISMLQKRIEQFRFILQPGFRQVTNIEMKNTFIENVKSLIGNGKNAKEVVSRLNKMNDRDLVRFIKNNPDLGAIAYGSPEVVKDFLDENAQSMLARLDMS